MSYYQLTENERYQIYSLRKAGHSQAEIAELLERHPSTISRELRSSRVLIARSTICNVRVLERAIGSLHCSFVSPTRL